VTSPDPAKPRRPLGLSATTLGLAAGLVAILLYLPALQFGWVWDDAGLVVSHGKGGVGALGFRPFTSFLYRMEWLAGIGSPALYHFVSLALHGTATWLFYRLALSAGAGAWLAFAAALLFAAHPIHVEAVAYISGRPDLLATVCALGALLIARSAPVCAPGGCRSWRLFPAYALLALAVLADEVALVTPLLLIGLDRWGEPRVPTRGRTTVYFGFAAVALAALLARIGAGALRVPTPHEGVAPEGVLWGVPIAALEYLQALLVPHPLDAMRSLTAPEAASWGLRLGAIAGLAALALYVWARRRDPLARVGALFLFAPLLPALPMTPFEVSFAEDRAAYFASTGFCLLVASVCSWLGARSTGRRSTAVVAGLVLAALAGTGTLARLPIWKDNVSLLSDTARRDPSDPAPHLVIAEDYFARGDLPGALAAVERSLAVDSTNVDALMKKTVLLTRMGRYPEAEADARRAIQAGPAEAVAWSNLGDVLTRQGKPGEAVQATRKAVELQPDNPDNWYNYGVALASMDSLPRAKEAYERAIAINPRHVEAINNLGGLLGAHGRIEEARDIYARAVAIAPASVQARMNLALACMRLGDREGLARERTAIQRLDPAAAAQLNQMIEASSGGSR
jgi:Flp pilus assembly protein TadD